MAWLKGVTALITGGGSGLGRALVERYLKEGAQVGVLEANADRAAQLKADFGKDVEVTTGDVTRFSDNRSAVERTVSKFGKLDCFIANAGTFDFFQSLADLDGETISAAFDELYSVNVKGVLLGAKAALPELLKTRGNMIFTASTSGFYTGGGGPLYTSSKHAVVGLVRQLAYELAPKIRVNGVAPGGMRTNLRGLKATGTNSQSLADIDQFDEMVISATPLRMSPKPADYCGPYVLLASKENAAPMTGVVVSTDGGIGIRGSVNVCGGENL